MIWDSEASWSSLQPVQAAVVFFYLGKNSSLLLNLCQDGTGEGQLWLMCTECLAVWSWTSGISWWQVSTLHGCSSATDVWVWIGSIVKHLMELPNLKSNKCRLFRVRLLVMLMLPNIGQVQVSHTYTCIYQTCFSLLLYIWCIHYIPPLSLLAL